MTAHKVRGGDVLAGAAALALLVVMFLPWYEFLEGVYEGTRTISPDETEQSAWEALGPLLGPLLLTALLGLLIFGTTLFERTQAWPVAAQVWVTAIGLITAIWTLIRIVNPPGPNFAAEVRWPAWAGLACVIAVVVGAVWSMRTEQRP
jgi:hypothetical protein